MRWDELIQGLDGVTQVRSAVAPAAPSAQSPNVNIQRVISDSRRVRPGDAFCAIAGHEADGHAFIPAALARGAAALIVQRPTPNATVPQVVVADTRKALGYLAHRCLGDPSGGGMGSRMTVIGVTGTKGKTTVTYLVESILKAAGHACGVLGTIAYRLGPDKAVHRPSHVTTPGADELAEMFATMYADGIRHVVMEVSSHALDQDRVGGIHFDAAIFTNLSGDHRDYHPTEAHYLSAKAKLFEGLGPDGAAILNRDAPASEAIAARTRAPVTWFGLSSAADVSAQIVAIDTSGSRIKLLLPGQEPVEVRLPAGLIGRHNVSNSLAAAAAAFRLGIAPDRIVAGLTHAPPVPGRLEPVLLPANAHGPQSVGVGPALGRPPVSVLVDYAHTDDALDNVLSAIRPMVGPHRLIVVFGCGGDRDRTKRPRMAAVAEHWADRVLVTSDNPRTERPEAIIDQIMVGFSQAGLAKVTRDADRRSAIATAINAAEPGDVVLIAGKGHEDYQVIGTQKIHFDDREVAGEMLRKRFGG